MFFGLVFMTGSFILISFIQPGPGFFPTQEVNLTQGLQYGKLDPRFLLMQEITASRNYLNSIEVFIAPQGEPVRNFACLINEKDDILYSWKFSTEGINHPTYYLLTPPHDIFIGKGKKYTLCLTSIDGNSTNYIAFPLTAHDSIGKLLVTPLLNNDVLSTYKGRDKAYPAGGGMGIKTYEDDGAFFSFKRSLWLIFCFILTLFIVFYRKMQVFLLRYKPDPAILMLILGFLSGSCLVFSIPPLQSPDEQSHFYRSYQISEGNIFKFNESCPRSLALIESTFLHIRFVASEKTDYQTIRLGMNVKLNSNIRTEKPGIPDYIFPYLPQAAGYTIGRIFTDSTLALFYIGRLFNLFVSLTILFFAIRIIPIHKWVLFMLALMPMTIFQLSTLSYDGIVINLSFLLTAYTLKLIYRKDQMPVSNKNLATILCLTFFLALCKPPYFLIGFLAVLIPISQFGSIKKYLIFLTMLVALTTMGLQFWSIRSIFQPSANHVEAITDSAKAGVEQVAKNELPKAPVVNSEEQKKFIRNNPGSYAKLLYSAIYTGMTNKYQETFIGRLGWIDTYLPGWFRSSYMLLLFLVAIFSLSISFSVGLFQRLYISGIVALILILIETGLYIYANVVANPAITGVQGRYFIPFAPLFFLLFYNKFAANGLFRASALVSKKRRTEGNIHLKKKQGARGKPVNNHTAPLTDRRTTDLISHASQLFIVVFTVFSLCLTLFYVLTRYYIITA